MTAQKDDLEAVRAVTSALEGFESSDQERIIRWAREKLGLPGAAPSSPVAPAVLQSSAEPGVSPAHPGGSKGPARDLKTFINEKAPKRDVHFAAAVAYYYRFEAPEPQRKLEINWQDLQEACRLANRRRLKVPLQTLRNAHMLGLLDKGTQRGYFALNAVGENLVAMTLPGDEKSVVRTRGQKSRRRPRSKAAARPKK